MNNSSLVIFCFRSYFDRNKCKIKQTGWSSFLLYLSLCFSLVNARDFLICSCSLKLGSRGHSVGKARRYIVKAWFIMRGIA